MKTWNKILMHSLAKNPQAWAESTAKTKTRVIISILTQAITILIGLTTIYVLVDIFCSTDSTKSLIPYAIMLGSTIIIGFGIILPSMYIYALYRLLQHIEEKKININFGN